MNKDLENLIQQMPNGIILIDQQEGKVELSNKNFNQMISGVAEASAEVVDRKIRQPMFKKFDHSESSHNNMEETG